MVDQPLSTWRGSMVPFMDGRLWEDNTTKNGKEQRIIALRDGEVIKKFTLWPNMYLVIENNREGMVWEVEYSTFQWSGGESLTVKRAKSLGMGSNMGSNTVSPPPKVSSTKPQQQTDNPFASSWTSTLSSKDRSIIRQVAFKGAVEKTDGEPSKVKDYTDQYEKILLDQPLEETRDEHDLDVEVVI